MKFQEVAVEFNLVISTWNQSWNILDACYNCACKLSHFCFGMNFIVKKFRCSHLVVIVSIFAIIFVSFLFFSFLLLQFKVLINLIVWHVEAHFTQNVTFSLSTAKIMSKFTYSASWVNSKATSFLPLAVLKAMSLYLILKQRFFST